MLMSMVCSPPFGDIALAFAGVYEVPMEHDSKGSQHEPTLACCCLMLLLR